MRNLKMICPLSFMIIFLPGYVHCQGFNLEFSDTRRTLTMQSEQAVIRSEWVSPIVQPAVSGETWEHISKTAEYDKLSGIHGLRTTDLFRNQDIEMERQVWISADHKVVAMRQKLSNFRKDPLILRNMVPFACKGGDEFRLIGNPEAKNWIINVQRRRKNEFPESIKPDGITLINADPFLAIPVRSDANANCLLIGYLDWTKHLAHINMFFKTEKSKTVLDRIFAHCEFDDCHVPPNGTRTTQWIYITIGQDFVTTVKEYANRVAAYHHVPEPAGNAPSVYCSWYWYGLNYSEEYFNRDLQALKDLKYRKPFDVFLIDESWGLHQWGDYRPNEKFPNGMKSAADRIRELGYIPGIWTPPYLVSPTSELAGEHPEWVIKNSDGSHYTFRMNNRDHWVIDPTYPGVLDHLEESFRKLSEDWGFKYFKFDFMRAVFLDGDYHFFNPHINRLEAYRMGLEAIRRGVGDDAYISVCGGHYGGSIGMANSQRSGSDVVSFWDPNEIPKYRQNMLRTWMSRLWHVDPDAMMVRRNENPEFTGSHAKLSLGLFTDQEAQVNALNQYIGGGLVTFTENYADLDKDRLELYKHVIPSVNASSMPLDWYDPVIPSMTITQIDPVCRDLTNWNTVSIVNWSDEEKMLSFALDNQVVKSLPGNQFLLFEFFSQRVKGLFRKNETIPIDALEPHSANLFKIIPWDGTRPVLAGTDLHFSMGGVEISEWKTGINSAEGRIETDWPYTVQLTVVFPARNDAILTKRINIHPNQKRFWVSPE